MSDDAPPDPAPSTPDTDTDPDTHPAPAGDDPARRGRRARAELGRQLEILALCGFVFAQPVLDTFGRSPETFLAVRAERGEIVGFALAVMAIPPLLLGLAALATLLAGARWRARTQVAIVGALVALLALRVVVDVTSWRATGAIVTGAAVGVVAALLYTRWSIVATYLRYAAVAPVLFVVLFVAFSPAGELLAGERAGASVADVSANAPPVVLVVLDELPTTTLLDGTGRIDDLYPSFARLAGDASWYRNATTVGPWTSAAIPALLTGRLGPRDAAPVASTFPDNLFTLLGGVYDLNVHEPLTAMCPTSLCEERERRPAAIPELLRQARTVWRDTIDPPPLEDVFVLHAGFDPRRVDRVDEFVSTLEPTAGPRLDYLHLMLPHVPHEYTPTGARYNAPTPPPGLIYTHWSYDEHVTDSARQAHVLQSVFADRQLGRILDRLESVDRYDESLVIVTADHGISFLPGERLRGVSEANYHDIAWVPLLVKAPGQTEAAVVDDNVELVDIVPTIAEHAGITVPWDVEGRALGGPDTRSPVTKRIQAWSINELAPTDGDVVELDGREGLRRVLEAGPAVPPSRDDDPLRPWRRGALGSLVGSAITDHRSGPPVDVTVALDDADAFADVDPDAPLPLFVAGDVRGVPAAELPGTRLVVAVDGVIGGWSTLVPTPQAGLHRFWTLVPDTLVGAGAHDVTFHLVEGSAGRPVLRPMAAG